MSFSHSPVISLMERGGCKFWLVKKLLDDLSEKGRKKYRNKQSSDNEDNDDEGDERFIS